jgi:hypothetical protein
MPHASDFRNIQDLLRDNPHLSAHFNDLASFPDVESMTASRRARLLGLAGECLVDSILLRLGLFPSAMPDGAPSDRLIAFAFRSIRLQIKTSAKPGPRGYTFRMQKGYRCSPAGRRPYAAGDFDIAALVALPHNAVMFSSAQSPTILMRFDTLAQLIRTPLASLDQALGDFLAREAADGLAMTS